jgi:hypothetical protein
MAIQSWHNKPQDITHKNGPDIARTGGRPKTSGPSPLHPKMRDRVTTTLGAPPTGAPPDASSPSPVDHEKQHGSKQLPVPALAHGMKSDPERGSYRPDGANEIMGEAILSGSTKLPATVKEN